MTDILTSFSGEVKTTAGRIESSEASIVVKLRESMPPKEIIRVFGQVEFRILEEADDLIKSFSILAWSVEKEQSKKNLSSSSWFTSTCASCGYNVIVTQSKKYDYFYYCSNKYCSHHSGEEVMDQDDLPSWA